MGSTWRKAKVALGLNLCVHVPRTLDDDEEEEESAGRLSDAAAEATSPAGSGYRALMPMTPTPTSSGLRMSKSGSRSSKVLSIFHFGTSCLSIQCYCNYIIFIEVFRD